MNRINLMTNKERVRHILERADFIASARLGLVPTAPLLDRYTPKPITLPAPAWEVPQ